MCRTGALAYFSPSLFCFLLKDGISCSFLCFMDDLKSNDSRKFISSWEVGTSKTVPIGDMSVALCV